MERTGSRLQGFAEAAGQVGVSTFTLRRLADGGHIRTVNIGARRLIPVEEVERIVREGAGQPRRRKAAARPSQGE
jgi:excisionase family DNA binding protein